MKTKEKMKLQAGKFKAQPDYINVYYENVHCFVQSWEDGLVRCIYSGLLDMLAGI